MAQHLRVRPFERIANDTRWSGQIDGDRYVWTVGDRAYRVKIAGTDTDERGPFALVEPYEEPLASGLWLQVAPERDEMVEGVTGELYVCCRISVQRVSEVVVDPQTLLRQRGLDPSSVNVLMWPPAVMADLSVLFLADGTPTQWTGPIRRVDERDGSASH